ncbi:transposase [Streptomyces oryzae]|uniref:Transposase n=1 Tax=Streptomyces oryzae TaxID=1434886 RepID=A0ABS3X4N8_9ACTN|nr:transposase [Streptomyces oryzae]
MSSPAITRSNSGDKAYSRRNRRYLRRRQIKPPHPRAGRPAGQPPTDGQQGRRRPAGFGKTIYKRRNEVERTINVLKNPPAVATRFDKRGCIFHGTATVASIRLRLRP